MTDGEPDARTGKIVKRPDVLWIAFCDHDDDPGLGNLCALPEEFGDIIQIVLVTRHVDIRKLAVVADGPHLGREDAAAVVDGVYTNTLTPLEALYGGLEATTGD